ncbi:hypothetical protein KUTeg_007644 [Tegillarca granosa]|uniref:SGNH hydrolase-type esterase domain-containing protein n=1 Tax=Tegillarca granosa TaxID=220873 RepID=A0ABQ9FDW7_TEGGR|nr:hypothetical protein KUTeg_007644 [Tegillarca granosa]
MSIRPGYVGAFFCNLSGTPVTRYQLISILKKCLAAAGFDSNLNESHSFRIGAATTAAMVLVVILILRLWHTSLVKYAFVRASESSFGKNLELERQKISVLWQGKGDMKWSEVQCKIRHLFKFIDPPNFIILHFGGNDTGECKSEQLINNIIASLKFIFEILPNTKVIRSQILPRLKWRHERTHAAVEKIR